jgi:hypothetical protein
MLMTPLLMHMARHHPRRRLDIARARTGLLERGLRESTIDALVIDERSLASAPDLRGAGVRPYPQTMRSASLRDRYGLGCCTAVSWRPRRA